MKEMKAMLQATNSERTGRWLGRAWRGFVRQEARAVQWLASKRLPAGVGRLLSWIVKLAVFGLLLYAALWLALLLTLAVLAAWFAQKWDRGHEGDPRWREGHSGFGLYDENEWRHDMGSPHKP
jgi:hypothetical protein